LLFVINLVQYRFIVSFFNIHMR